MLLIYIVVLTESHSKNRLYCIFTQRDDCLQIYKGKKTDLNPRIIYHLIYVVVWFSSLHKTRDLWDTW
jgi:hypothetical protein